MKEKLSAVELSFVIKELQSLVGAKIEKIFGMPKPKDVFLFALHLAGQPKTYLYLDLQGVVCQVDFKPNFPDTPPHAVASLRRKLHGSRITAISQRGLEQLITITCEGKHGISHMHVELLAPGNLVLTDAEGKILACVYHKTWSEKRDVRPGKIYVAPEPKVDPRTLSPQELKDLLVQSKSTELVKALAIACSLGGQWAEALLKQANIPKETNIEEVDAAYLHEQLHQFLNQELKPVYAKKEALPFNGEGESMPSFSAAIAKHVLNKEEAKEKKAKEKKTSATRNKFEKIVDAQKKQLASLQKKERELQAQGELMYEKYSDLATLLTKMQEDSTSISPKEFKKKYESLPYITKLNLKEKTVTFEVKE